MTMRHGFSRSLAVSTVLLALAGCSTDSDVGPDTGQRTISQTERTGDSRQAAWSAIAPRIRQAELDSDAAAERALTRISDFITEGKLGAKPFAEMVLGFEAKIKAIDTGIDSAVRAFRKLTDPEELAREDKFWSFNVEGQPPQAPSTRLQDFVEEKFRKHVIDPAALQKVVKQAIADYVAEVGEIENQLLVAIRADLGDDYLKSLPEMNSTTDIQGRYQDLIIEVANAAGTDFQVGIGREAASWVAGDVATAVTIKVATTIAGKLGLSGGVLSTGAGSSIATFGVGLVVSFAIDMIIHEILKAAGYDPEAEVIAKVKEALDRTLQILVEGDSGLREEFRRIGTLRSQLRRATLKKLFLEGGAQ